MSNSRLFCIACVTTNIIMIVIERIGGYLPASPDSRVIVCAVFGVTIVALMGDRDLPKLEPRP